MDHIDDDVGGQYSGGSDSEEQEPGDSEEQERASFFCTGEFAQRVLSPKVKENSQRRSQSQHSTKQPRATSKRPPGSHHRVLQPLRGKEFGLQVQGRKQQDEMSTSTRNNDLKKMQKQMEEMQKENASLKRKSEADEKKLTSKEMKGGGECTWVVVENREKNLVFRFKAGSSRTK